MNKKDNQRVRLTKQIFRNALIILLQKKPIYQISVTELCDVAELNRSTFYKHYGNVRDILSELENEVLQKSRQCMQEITAAENTSNITITPLYRLLCDMQKNRKIYRMLLNSSHNNEFSSGLIQETIEFLLAETQILDIKEDKKSEYIFRYLSSGCMSVIQNWINGPMEESPMEISKMLFNISLTLLETISIDTTAFFFHKPNTTGDGS